MASTELAKKEQRKKNRVRSRSLSMKVLNAKPVIKKVTVEELKAEFAK